MKPEKTTSQQHAEKQPLLPKVTASGKMSLFSHTPETKMIANTKSPNLVPFEFKFSMPLPDHLSDDYFLRHMDIEDTTPKHSR